MLTHIIVGTGRCGTGSVRNLLRDNQVPCGHEAFFGVTRREPLLTEAHITARALARTDLVAESSWLAAPYLDRTALVSPTTKIIHLYRHPYQVIKSLLDLRFFSPNNTYPEYPSFAFRHSKRLSKAYDDTRNALIFYIEWNKMIRKALLRFDDVFTHRIEDDTVGLCRFLGFPQQQLLVANQKSIEKSEQVVLEDVAERVQSLPEYPELVCLNEELGYKL